MRVTCEYCGREQEWQKDCESCGASLKKSPKTKEDPPKRVHYNNSMQDSAPQNSTQNPQPEKKSKLGGCLVAAFVVVFVFVLICIAIGALTTITNMNNVFF